LLATLAVLVALSGGPDYAAIAQPPLTAPASAPPRTPVASTPAPVLTSAPSGGTAHVADMILAPPDVRLEPALDWFNWDRLAECETGGRWDLQGPLYGGGLQILSTTWRNFGGTEFADLPGHATREQQIVVGRAIAEALGWHQWPGCAKRLGL
jgi:hypothetical protein